MSNVETPIARISEAQAALDDAESALDRLDTADRDLDDRADEADAVADAAEKAWKSGLADSALGMPVDLEALKRAHTDAVAAREAVLATAEELEARRDAAEKSVDRAKREHALAVADLAKMLEPHLRQNARDTARSFALAQSTFMQVAKFCADLSSQAYGSAVQPINYDNWAAAMHRKDDGYSLDAEFTTRGLTFSQPSLSFNRAAPYSVEKLVALARERLK